MTLTAEQNALMTLTAEHGHVLTLTVEHDDVSLAAPQAGAQCSAMLTYWP